MLPLKSRILFTFALFALLPLGACAGTPWADSVERSLAADPRLQSSPAILEAAQTPSPLPSSTVSQLPADFPGEIPRYPNAELIAATPDQSSDATTQTRWTTADSAEQVRQYYTEQLQTNGWRLSQPAGATDSGQPIAAQRDGLQLTLAIDGNPGGTGQTAFTLTYQFDSRSIAQSPDPNAPVPQPGDPNFVGPVLPASTAQSPAPAAATTTAAAFTDLNQAPAQLRSYIADLAKLGVLQQPSASGTASKSETGNTFKPNQAITRREYARWLVAANNAIYANQPARQLQLGTTSDQPAFQDVPRTDPDFGAIQALANAGLTPSRFSGNDTVVSFRPDAPLTREDLLLWKGPLDLRRSLPNATIEAVQQTWGFQDAARIDPRALRAVLADFQNGDLSNIRRAFGYTTLFQPKKAVTRAEAAAVLWFFGSEGDGLSAKDALQSAQNLNPADSASGPGSSPSPSPSASGSPWPSPIGP